MAKMTIIHGGNVQCLPLRATTFDERTKISTINMTDDGNSQTCKKNYNPFRKKKIDRWS
jgi:hypothetical protein